MRFKLLFIFAFLLASAQVWAASDGNSQRGGFFTSVIAADIEALDFGDVEVRPVGLFQRLPVAEGLQAELQQPLRLLFLRGDEADDVLIQAFRHEIGLNVGHKAVFIVLACDFADDIVFRIGIHFCLIKNDFKLGRKDTLLLWYRKLLFASLPEILKRDMKHRDFYALILESPYSNLNGKQRVRHKKQC